LPKNLSEKQKEELIKSFSEGTSINYLSEKYNFTKITISRNLKKLLGEEKYKELLKKSNSLKSTSVPKKIFDDASDNNFDNSEILLNKEIYNKSNKTDKSEFNQNATFVEILPLKDVIDCANQKDLSSVPIINFSFPKVVYMIVDNKIELEIKVLKDFPEWNFLSKDDLNRKTIKIYFDIKIAKRDCSKDQKVIKVPNPDVFKIAAPLLVSRGISRLVSEEKLIAL
tara:strand:+ start:548 stop:1225 length:678 start_codon:yes stop_codon:yes gene_type:complete